jgi:hypothetical protein
MSDMIKNLMQAVREVLTPEQYEEFIARLENSEPFQMEGYYAFIGDGR